MFNFNNINIQMNIIYFMITGNICWIILACSNIEMVLYVAYDVSKTRWYITKKQNVKQNYISYISPFYKGCSEHPLLLKQMIWWMYWWTFSSEPFPHLGCVQNRCIFDLVRLHYMFNYFYLLYLFLHACFIIVYTYRCSLHMIVLFTLGLLLESYIFVNLKIKTLFFSTWGQFWPLGIVVACSCLYVCVCISRACPCHNSSPFQARITKLGPMQWFLVMGECKRNVAPLVKPKGPLY